MMVSITGHAVYRTGQRLIVADRHDRSRSPRRERDRDRSRSPGPRKGDLLSRIGDKIWGPLEIEQPDQRDMFVGIKYHFHATTEFERRASTPIRLELNVSYKADRS